MTGSPRFVVGVSLGLILIGAPAGAKTASAATLKSETSLDVVVPGEVALGSFMALSDGHLKKIADDFSLVASSTEARTARWQLIRETLAAVGERNVDALMWFALPDGSYWSVELGKSTDNLSDRAYFRRVLAGETVIGALVVSKSTGRCSAIVAVPIWGHHHDVVGVLGASVYLDQLSARLNTEMAIGPESIFYSFDSTPLLAVEWDPSLVFVDPLSLGPEIRAVFEYMLARDQGEISYVWANRSRTILFRRSPLTGWWYVFGVVD